MEQKTTKYTIVSPEGVNIRGVQTSNIIGIHFLLKREGCTDSENFFTDEQKAIALDDIQIHLAKVYKANVKASTDILFCINKNKIFLAEAKFRVGKVRNVSKREIDDKIAGSRDLLEDERMQLLPTIYLLFSTPFLTHARINELKRIFYNSPKYQFFTAVEFYNLFE